MAVAIKGMSMPKSCHECDLEWRREDGVLFCPLIEKYTGSYNTERLFDCPLYEIKTPVKESRAKARCVCGHYKPEMWYGSNSCALSCPACHRSSGWFSTEIEAIRAWNKMMAAEQVTKE